jgi:protein-tyrosine-phosphatase
MPDPAPCAVLFACNSNRVRSPMAEALLKRLVGDRIFVDSCGLRSPEPEAGHEGDLLARAVMNEIGCDLADHAPKAFADLQDGSFDLVISLTPEAQTAAEALAATRSVELEYWPTVDPTLTDGSREMQLGAYRDVRDALAARIAARFGPVSE